MASLNGTSEGEERSLPGSQSLAGPNPLLWATTLLWFYLPGLLSRCGARASAAFPILDSYLSEAAISKRLARARIQVAQKRHDQHFLYNLNLSHRNPAKKLGNDAEQLCGMLPPRRAWARSNRVVRSRFSSKRITEISILNAIKIARRSKDTPAWLSNLRVFIKQTRRRLHDVKRMEIAAPRVTLIPKDKVKKTFRPLATFSLSDQAIIGPTADCLRATIDGLLSKSCYAFRTCPPGRSAPQHHDAVEDLRSYIVKNNANAIYVAECDIQKFFDAVSHEVATKSLEAMLSELRAQGRFYDRRIPIIFKAYLASYTYPASVDKVAPAILAKMRVPSGSVPWVREEIEKFYPDGMPETVGVPQGGALSPVIANIVLHTADLAIHKKAIELGETNYFYARYCDDMVIASTDRKVTQALFDAYLAALRSLRLPYHPPTQVEKFSKNYFDHKSKAVYPYGSEYCGGVTPWIAFLGYQIRYDGRLRVRKSSISKEIEKQVTIYKDVLRSVSLRGANMRVSGKQAHHRARMRLIAMSVGRANISTHGPDAGHEMCWVNGFELLKKYPHSKSQLKTLDRVRASLLTKLKFRLASVPTAERKKIAKEILKYYGRPFSYFAQFNKH